MKITKRELTKVIKEEIINSLLEILGDQEVAAVGEIPFEAAGMIEPPAENRELLDLEAKMKELVADTSIPEKIKRDKLRALMSRIEELESVGT